MKLVWKINKESDEFSFRLYVSYIIPNFTEDTAGFAKFLYNGFCYKEM